MSVMNKAASGPGYFLFELCWAKANSGLDYFCYLGPWKYEICGMEKASRR